MKRFSLDIKAKFGVVIAVVLAAVAICGWSGIHASNGLNSHVKTLYDKQFAGMRTIAELNVNLGHIQDEAVNYALGGDKGENTELHGRDPVIRRELAAEQIVAAAKEQNAGMDQITVGMREASQAAGEFVAGTEEAQATVEALNTVAAELEQLASAYKV
jgi:nitrogen fixation protein FixH